MDYTGTGEKSLGLIEEKQTKLMDELERLSSVVRAINHAVTEPIPTNGTDVPPQAQSEVKLVNIKQAIKEIRLDAERALQALSLL